MGVICHLLILEPFLASTQRCPIHLSTNITTTTTSSQHNSNGQPSCAVCMSSPSCRLPGLTWISQAFFARKPGEIPGTRSRVCVISMDACLLPLLPVLRLQPTTANMDYVHVLYSSLSLDYNYTCFLMYWAPLLWLNTYTVSLSFSLSLQLSQGLVVSSLLDSLLQHIDVRE